MYASVLPEPTDGVGSISREDVRFDLHGEGHRMTPRRVVLRWEGDIEPGPRFEDRAGLVGSQNVRGGCEIDGYGDVPHGLDSIWEDDLLVGFSFLLVAPSMMDEFHPLEDRRIRQSKSTRTERQREERQSLPDSPAPRRNSWIPFLAIIRSFLS